MINCLVLKLDNIHIFAELDTTNKKKNAIDIWHLGKLSFSK